MQRQNLKWILRFLLGLLEAAFFLKDLLRIIGAENMIFRK
jgi:hypothetical protein